jgi:uncharacterized protein YndB with AHSA1/START domain
MRERPSHLRRAEMSDEDSVTITVHHRFAVSAERVYDGFLDAATASKFLFRTPAGRVMTSEIDARVGGKYLFTERRNGEDVNHVGEYLELERPRKIVFTFGVPKYSQAVSTVTMEIVPCDAGCDLKLTSTGVANEWAERTHEGWSIILRNADKVLAA